MEHRKRLLAITVLIGGVLLGVFLSFLDKSGSEQSTQFRRIRLGMGKKDVTELIGEPTREVVGGPDDFRDQAWNVYEWRNSTSLIIIGFERGSVSHGFLFEAGRSPLGLIGQNSPPPTTFGRLCHLLDVFFGKT
jgi:hypothetical protein